MRWPSPWNSAAAVEAIGLERARVTLAALLGRYDQPIVDEITRRRQHLGMTELAALESLIDDAKAGRLRAHHGGR